MECVKCGKILDIKDNFCSGCGAKVKKLKTEENYNLLGFNLEMTLNEFRNECKYNSSYKNNLLVYRDELKTTKEHFIYSAFVAILLGNTGMNRSVACKNMGIGQGMLKDVVLETLQYNNLYDIFEKYKNKDNENKKIIEVEAEILGRDFSLINDIISKFNVMVFNDSQDIRNIVNFTNDDPTVNNKNIEKLIKEESISNKKQLPEFEYELINNGKEYKIIKYNGTSDKVNIPSTVNGKKVTEIGSYQWSASNKFEDIINGRIKGALEGCKTVKSVSIPMNIVSICNNAFYGCENLKEVTINMPVEEIGHNAFRGCNKELLIVCLENSVAHDYANNNSIKFQLANSFDDKKGRERIAIKELEYMGYGRFINCKNANEFLRLVNESHGSKIHAWNNWGGDGDAMIKSAIREDNYLEIIAKELWGLKGINRLSKADFY